SDYPGVWLTGNNLTFDRDLVHDNGQDEFQGDGTNGAVNNITIKNSWLYDHRVNTNYAGFGFNNGPHSAGCTHVDGLQIYAGGGQSGLTFDEDIIGPYLMQDIYPSDVSTYYNSVSITNSLLLSSSSNNVNVDAQSSSTNPSGWTFTNDTSFVVPSNPDSSGYGWTNLDINSGSNFTSTSSIFANGYGVTSASATGSGNVYFNTGAVPGGTKTNPLFTSAPTTATPTWSTWASSNFTPGCTGCSGKGSPLHSFGDLAARIDSLNTPNTPNTPTTPTLQSISVTPANASVTAGKTQQYTATGISSDGSQQNVTSTATWSTGNSAVATINSSGLLTAVAAGTTTVSAVQSGITGSTTVTVTSGTVTSGTGSSSTNGLSFTADKGTIASPFVWTAGSPGYVSQTTDTSAGSPAAGGQASYVFNVAAAGTYTLNVQLSAADAGSNSVYLSVDAAPSSNTQIFDMPTTTGFQTYAASARGSGGSTYTADQYVPVVWNLSAGTHTLYVSGREANTQIASFTFVQRTSSVTSSASFTDHALSPTQTGSFELMYDVTPVASTSSGVIGQSQYAPTAYTDLATGVAFEPTGVIDARNGVAYRAATTVNWVANHAYHFRLDIHIASHTYDIYVTPPGGSEITLGSNYAFRTEQQSSTSLGHWTAVTTQGGTYSNLTICNTTVH
ncbi:MAG: Ig-like domain-containing protein, partial [Ktedonobacterales bacterium]